MKDHILIIDDDIDLTSMLQDYFEAKGYQVSLLHRVDQLPSLDGISLILLDINLPDEDGFSICRQIRREGNLPIIFISARTSEADKVKGLMMGGDDYIEKPFSLAELSARVHTNINRSRRETFVHDCLIDREGFRFIVRGQPIDLTGIEFDLVDLLLSHPNQVLSKERIYDQLWGYDAEGDAQVVSEHIRNIRNKLKAVAPDKTYIKTVWGIGYSWIG